MRPSAVARCMTDREPKQQGMYSSDLDAYKLLVQTSFRLRKY